MNKPARYMPTSPLNPPTGARPGAAFPVPDGFRLPLVLSLPRVVVVPPLALPPPPVVIVPSVVVIVLLVFESSVVLVLLFLPESSVVVGDPRAAPPVMVVVSWSEAVGRFATTVTLCAAVDSDGLYDVAAVKPQVLMMSSRSRKKGVS